jgi:hypothetical protein
MIPDNIVMFALILLAVLAIVSVSYAIYWLKEAKKYKKECKDLGRELGYFSEEYFNAGAK